MKNIAIELKWAVLITVATFTWMLLEKTMGWHHEHIANHYWLTLLFFPILIFLYTLALREKRRKYYQGSMSWVQGFFSGAILSVILAIFAPLSQYVIHTYITPHYFPNIIEFVVESGQMPREKAEAYFTLTSYIIQAAIGAVVGGLVISAVVAVFLKRKKTVA
ncbi:MAG: DUF4199 domain-containing protein [Flavobacteriaceae bacterium]|nr:DUF4199 domain-containing protein [Flavobacteriaceae bacterium]